MPQIPELPPFEKVFSFQKIVDLYQAAPKPTRNFFDLRNLGELDYQGVPKSTKRLVFPIATLFIFVGIIGLLFSFRKPFLLIIALLFIFMGLKILQRTALHYMEDQKGGENYQATINSYNYNSDRPVHYSSFASEYWNRKMSTLFSQNSSNLLFLTNFIHYKAENFEIVAADFVSNTTTLPLERTLLYLKTAQTLQEVKAIKEQALENWIQTHFAFDIKALFDLSDITLTAKENSFLLCFPSKLKSPKLTLSLIAFFADWCLAKERFSIESNPLFLLNNALTADNVALHGLGIGDQIRKLALNAIDKIHSKGDVGIPSLPKQMRLLKSNDGQVSLKNGAWFNVKNGRIISIFFGPIFWKKELDLNLQNYVTYFGEADLIKKGEKEGSTIYYHYSARNLTLMGQVGKINIQKIAFGYQNQ